MFKRIHIIINPAAGQERPVLNIFNTIFHPAEIDWQVSITHKPGDAIRFAKQAAQDGVDAVGVYGGDGSVMEVASGLIGTNVPLAIFPGGTANVMSVELGIASDLAEACALVSGDASIIREVDMGQIGDRYFILRTGIGMEANMVEGADRDLKNRMGPVAYWVAALQALRETKVSKYRMVLDGKIIESDGITCIVNNAGSVGGGGLSIAPNISVSDGLLDVVLIRSGDLGSLLSVAASVVAGNEDAQPLDHWQAKEITIEADPPQTVQTDGEVIGQTPITIKTLPKAVRIIVPKPVTEQAANAQTASAT